jgi:FAD/FMN-containing dehydrogenase
MKRVSIDPASATIKIQGGVLARELDELSNKFNLAVPLGTCPAVGVAGYALGGGEGALTPKFGYACDSIIEADIITADGRLLTANENQHRDLFWAVRGAGANFGVATSISFRAHPIYRVLSGSLKYPIGEAAAVLPFINDYVREIPDDLFLMLTVLSHRGTRILDVGLLRPDSSGIAINALNLLRNFGRPIEDTIRVIDYIDYQRAGSDGPADGDYASCRRGGHFDDLTSEAIATILEYTSNPPSEKCDLTMIYWHGPWSSLPRDNAFGCRRNGYEYWIHSYWRDGSQDLRAVRWVHDFFRAMMPFSTGAVYVNDLEDEGEARVRAAYGYKFDRLQRIKRAYDPNNVFRVNQNIPPASLDA